MLKPRVIKGQEIRGETGGGEGGGGGGEGGGGGGEGGGGVSRHAGTNFSIKSLGSIKLRE